MRFGPEICRDFGAASSREWLETNGLGGYACATVSGANTRRSHAVLAACNPHTGRRTVYLARLEESVVLDGISTGLSCNVYADSIHPRGYLRLTEFSADPFPGFVFADERFEIRKTLFMPHGENATVVRYRLLRAAGPVLLELRPLVTSRGAGELTVESAAQVPIITNLGNRLLVHFPSEASPFQIAHNGARAIPTGHWYRSFRFPADGPEGGMEDLYNPFVIQFSGGEGSEAWIVASTRTEAVHQETVDGWCRLEDHRRSRLAFARGRKPRSSEESGLLRAADRFLIRRQDGSGAICDRYPLPSGSTRAACIALPGLTLVTGRRAHALGVLRELAARSGEGLLPELASGPGDLEASLWFVHAVDRYLRYTGDVETVDGEFYPVVRRVVEACRDGACPEQRADSDGLVLTPRADATGFHKRVDLQALWYNALGVALFLAQNARDRRPAREFSALSRRCRASFHRLFGDPVAGSLRDAIGSDGPDDRVSPRQLLVSAFADSMLERRQRQAVVERILQEYWSPHGPLRLDNWWTGPLATSYVLAHGRSPSTLRFVQSLLAPLFARMSQADVGSLSTHLHGEPWDAVAVAEMLRVFSEHILDSR